MVIINIILIIILLLIGAFTAASEIAVIAASIIKLKRLAAEGSKKARIILKILEMPDKFFGTILVANNIVDALIASLVTAILFYFIKEKGRAIVFATIISSFLIIVFEVTAKTLAANNPVRLSLSFSRPVKTLIFIFSPVVRVLSAITNFIVKLLTGDAKRKPSLVVEEELRALIKIGEQEGAPGKEKYKMLSKVFDFGERIVKDVMVARKDMFCIDTFANIDDILDKALESGYSRIPVYKQNPDKITGIVNMKDLLNLSVNKGLIILEDIIYPSFFVEESKKVTELLKEFQKGHTHLAIVLNPQGKISGIVTLEDLLEEIVGEIEDEYDIRHPGK